MGWYDVQGIGGALYEECVYSEGGQLLNASMTDDLVPMAAEIPDIVIEHAATPIKTSTLGGSINEQPMTLERVL